MLRHTLTALVFSLSTTAAFAGSQSLDCVSRDKTTSIAAGNSDLKTQIKFIDKDGKPALFEGTANIMPDFNYSSNDDDKTINAIPVSPQTDVREKHQTMKVTHKKDGSVCYGRQAWDDRYTQTYVLTRAKDAGAIRYMEAFRDAKKIPGLTKDGYVVAQFSCHSYGVTTAGGCRVEEDGDKAEWVDDKDVPGDDK